MKQLLSALFIALTLLSCSKDSDEDETPETTVNFTNSLSRKFDNVVIGSWKGGPATVIKKVGTLNAGATTGEIPITDETLIKVYFYYDEGGKTYMTPHGFGIAQGTFNNWAINDNIIFDEIQKTDELYPK